MSILYFTIKLFNTFIHIFSRFLGKSSKKIPNFWQIIETQNENWKKIEKQIEVLIENIHEMRNCDQLLYTRQVNFKFEAISSLLSLYSSVKSYRIEFFAFQMNIVNSIPSLRSQYVPMSLLPKESLEIIVEPVDDEQEISANRFSLAIPKQELLSYYEWRLLLDVLTLDDGLLMTMAIPFASRHSAFTLLLSYGGTPTTGRRYCNKVESGI